MDDLTPQQRRRNMQHIKSRDTKPELTLRRALWHSGLSCIKIVEENGHNVYFYRLYRGSHTYDTKEFYRLLEGTIQECKEQGIETATPDEVNHMIELWGKERGHINDKDRKLL